MKPLDTDEVARLDEIQKTHYEETGEWKTLADIIRDEAYDNDIELSTDDNS